MWSVELLLETTNRQKEKAPYIEELIYPTNGGSLAYLLAVDFTRENHGTIVLLYTSFLFGRMPGQRRRAGAGAVGRRGKL